MVDSRRTSQCSDCPAAPAEEGYSQVHLQRTEKLRADMQRFDLSPEKADYHLSMLETALVIERCGEILDITPTGILYLENVEARR